MKKLLSLSFFSLITSTLIAQNSIKGTITDKTDNSKVAAVSVYIVELNKAKASDGVGVFTFDNVPEGKLSIRFQRIGYATVVKQIMVNAGENNLNFEMQTSALETREVVISAPYSSDNSGTAYKTDAIDRADMQQDGTYTLTESLTRIPGINQLSTGVGVTKPVIRGLYGNRVLTTIDGFRFDNQQWQDEHGLGLSDMGIDRVEIIKGPASVIYGSDAMGGVINLIEENNAPVGKIVGDFNTRFHSNTLGSISDIGVKGSTEKYHWKIRAGAETNANYLDGGNNIVPNTRYNGGGVKANFGFNKSWVTSDFNYNFSFYQFGIIEANEALKPIVDEEEERFGREMEEAHHTVSYHLLSTKNTFYAGKSKFVLNAGAHLNNRQEEEGDDDVDKRLLEMQLNTYSYNLKWIAPTFARSELILGTQGTFQTNENSGTRVLIPDAKTSEFSGYAFLKHNLNKLIIEEGVRGNIYTVKTTARGNADSIMAVNNAYMNALDNKYRTGSGSVGGVYNVTTHVYVKANFSSGYRAPNLAELSSNGLHEGSTRYEKGSYDLKSENNFEIDGSVNYHNSWLMADLAAYQNKINDFIYIAPGANLFQSYKVYNYEQTNAVLTGGEASVDIKFPFLTALEYRTSYATLTAKASGGGYIPLMPADKFNNELKYNLQNYKLVSKGFVKAGFTYVFEQNKLAATELRTPSYNLVNVALGGTIKVHGVIINTTLFCTNLFAVNYYDHLSRVKPGSFGDPAIGFYNPGRNIGISLNVPFAIK